MAASSSPRATLSVAAAFSGALGVALLLGSLAPAPAAADPASASRDVIERQLDAFARDAWTEAFEFASPGIQSMFRSPERFSEMVRGGYPMVWRPSAVEFLGVEQGERHFFQFLRITDAAGVAYIARYAMVEIDGAWRIAGVEIQRAPDGSV